MDPLERKHDPLSHLLAVLAGHQAAMWTALPATVVSYNSALQTVVAQPTIQGVLTAPNLKESYTTLPEIPDVPICFPRGGGYTLTFPIAAGDECLLIFASRCIDNWWAQGGVQPPYDRRMHDLSDAFAIFGPVSQPHALAGATTNTTQLRSDDGSTLVELNQAGGIVRLKSSAEIILDSPTVSLTGALTATGNITGNGISLDSHMHTDPQGGDTGPPI